jgi:hypothetical protein
MIANSPLEVDDISEHLPRLPEARITNETVFIVFGAEGGFDAPGGPPNNWDGNWGARRFTGAQTNTAAFNEILSKAYRIAFIAAPGIGMTRAEVVFISTERVLSDIATAIQLDYAVIVSSTTGAASGGTIQYRTADAVILGGTSITSVAVPWQHELRPGTLVRIIDGMVGNARRAVIIDDILGTNANYRPRANQGTRGAPERAASPSQLRANIDGGNNLDPTSNINLRRAAGGVATIMGVPVINGADGHLLLATTAGGTDILDDGADTRQFLFGTSGWTPTMHINVEADANRASHAIQSNPNHASHSGDRHRIAGYGGDPHIAFPAMRLPFETIEGISAFPVVSLAGEAPFLRLNAIVWYDAAKPDEALALIFIIVWNDRMVPGLMIIPF